MARMATHASPGRSGTGLSAEIDAFRRDYESLSNEADVLVAPLTDEQFLWKPSPDYWSVGQCIDHLNVAARLYLPALDEGIASAIRRGLYGPGPYRYNWIGRLMVASVAPPPRFRVKTPRAYEPMHDRRRQEVMCAFRAYQVQYVDRLRQANGLDIARARVASPVLRWLRLPLGSAFALTIAHERRHLLQAAALIRAPGFPR
jgi:hypothetical protein